MAVRENVYYVGDIVRATEGNISRLFVITVPHGNTTTKGAMLPDRETLALQLQNGTLAIEPSSLSDVEGALEGTGEHMELSTVATAYRRGTEQSFAQLGDTQNPLIREMIEEQVALFESNLYRAQETERSRRAAFKAS